MLVFRLVRIDPGSASMRALQRTSQWLFVLLATAMLAACATGPQVRTDQDPTADFSKYRTW